MFLPLPSEFNATHLEELDHKRRRKLALKNKRWALYQRFGGCCAYCGIPLLFDGDDISQKMTEDHIIPKKPVLPMRRPDDISNFHNLACCCRSCNKDKSNHPVWDWWQSREDIWDLGRAKRLHDHMHDGTC